jgi:hypothetical protein
VLAETRGVNVSRMITTDTASGTANQNHFQAPADAYTTSSAPPAIHHAVIGRLGHRHRDANGAPPRGFATAVPEIVNAGMSSIRRVPTSKA